MGNTTITNVKCELCNSGWGWNPIFYISDSGHLNGHTLCIDCYEIEHSNLKRKRTFKRLTCEWCGYTSRSICNQKPVFKISWKGKFGNRIMCEQCVYDRHYRQSSSQKKHSGV